MLVLTGCSGPASYNMDLQVIGHGGSGENADAPINSLASVETALIAGVDGIELDMQLTSDGHLIAYHSKDLDDLTSCSGIVHTHTLEELSKCSNTSYGPIAHPILDQATLLPLLQAFPNASLTIDAKLFTNADWHAYLVRFASSIKDLAWQLGTDRVLRIECQDMVFLDLVSTTDPSIQTFYYTTDPAADLDLVAGSPVLGIVVHADRMDQPLIEAYRSIGKQIALFACPGLFGHGHCLDLAPDIIQSDAPEKLLRKLGRLPSP